MEALELVVVFNRHNLLPLAVTNPFFVGELISVSRPGAAPADNPKESLTGFVEAITWGHIVIRDFKKKQARGLLVDTV